MSGLAKCPRKALRGSGESPLSLKGAEGQP